MLHLAVKSLNIESPFGLGACNDIKAMYHALYHLEKQFVPLSVITGGLFRLNVEVSMEGCDYYIVNIHYDGKWAPASIRYEAGQWYVMVKGANSSYQVPRER